MGNKSSREDDFDELDLKPPEPPEPLPKRSRTNPPATPPRALAPAIVAEPEPDAAAEAPHHEGL